MSNPVWPLTLPDVFLVDGFQESPPDILIRTKTDAGPSKVRPRYTTGPRAMTGTVSMTKAQLGSFDTFYRDTCRGGELPFDWSDPRQGAGTPATFRFLKVEYSPHSKPSQWRVALTLETVPSAPAATGYRAIVLADAPTAYWRLGEMSGTAAVDEMGVFPGTYSGVVLGASSAIASGSAAFFNGTTSSVNFAGTTTTLGASGMNLLTAEMWIKTTYASATQRFPLDKPKNSFSAYAFIVANNVLHFRVGQATNSVFGVDASVAINDGLWHHVVGVKDAAGVTIYVDGVLRGTNLAGFTIEDNQAQTARLGTHIGGDEFPGTLDEVALYRNTALSAARILAHYTAGVPTWPASLSTDFLLDSYTEEPASDLIRSELKGPADVRSRGRAGVAPMTGGISASKAGVQTFHTFFTVTLAHGSLAFAWNDPRTRAVRRFRFTNPPVYTPAAPDVWMIRVETEELP